MVMYISFSSLMNGLALLSAIVSSVFSDWTLPLFTLNKLCVFMPFITGVKTGYLVLRLLPILISTSRCFLAESFLCLSLPRLLLSRITSFASQLEVSTFICGDHGILTFCRGGRH